MVNNCYKCGEELTEKEKQIGKKQGTYLCRKCDNHLARDWYRKFIVYGKGDKVLKGNKRPYPTDDKCELCKRKVFLVYHHWDDKDVSKGMWICHPKCHMFVEVLDTFGRIFVEKYAEIRRKIDGK